MSVCPLYSDFISYVLEYCRPSLPVNHYSYTSLLVVNRWTATLYVHMYNIQYRVNL